jgi:hypothetical protein
MERVVAGHLRQVWGISKWLYESQHGFRPGYMCESQRVTVCQDIADSLVEGARIGSIIIDFSKTFYLVPYDRLLMKIAASEVDSRVVVWVREFLLGRSQRG